MYVVQLFRRTPVNVRVVFLVFISVPLLTSMVGRSPSVVFEMEGFWRCMLATTCYWALPALLCYAILFKHYLFLPLYLLQCVALLLHAIVHSSSIPLDMLSMRYILVVMMAYIGMLFGNKDFLYPLMTRNTRLWRVAPRLNVSIHFHLADELIKQKIPAVMHNCSLSGMAVSVDYRFIHGFLEKKKNGDRVMAVLRWAGIDRVIPLQVVWITNDGEKRRLGFRVHDPEMMREFMVWLREWHESERKFNPAANQLLNTSGMSSTAFVLWVVCILLSFGLPVIAINAL